MKHLLLFLLIFVSVFTYGNTKSIFVSAEGNDANDGTLNSPFASIIKARDEVRILRAQNPDHKYIIYLREGIYRLNNTLELNSNDSGTETEPLIISAYRNEKVSIQGGVVIDPAHVAKVSDQAVLSKIVSEARDNIYKIDLIPLGITDYGNIRNAGFGRPSGPAWLEVFINKKAYHLARWPNTTSELIGAIVDPGSFSENRGGEFHFSTTRPQRWEQAEDVWISGYFMHGYADDAVKVEKIDNVKKTIKTVHPTLYGFGTGADWRRWFAFNLLEEIDYPQEYFVDRENGILYFYKDEPVETIEISLLETALITLNGASNVVIQNICLENSREKGIDIRNGSNNLIKNCVLRNLGSVAVNIAGWYESPGYNNGVAGCEIYQVGAGGVRLFGGDKYQLIAANDYVKNCKIYDFNRIEKSYKPGVDIYGTGNSISHCEIFSAPSMAILLHGNNHLIEYNNIHNVCEEVDDQGVIYTGRNPTQRGTTIQYNYFHHIRAGTGGHGTATIYHDDGACGVKVLGNIFYKAGNRAALIGGGSDNSYINNIFIDCIDAITVDNRFQTWAKPSLPTLISLMESVNYQNPPYSVHYPEIVDYVDNNPALPKRNVVDKNVFFNVGKNVNGSMAFLEYSTNNWVTTINPGFVDMDTENFDLIKRAMVFAAVRGFQRVDFDNIGLLNINYEGSDLVSMCNVNDSSAIVSTEKYKIFKTSDKAIRWIEAEMTPYNQTNDFSGTPVFFNDTTGFVALKSSLDLPGTLMKTMDGGYSWDTIAISHFASDNITPLNIDRIRDNELSFYDIEKINATSAYAISRVKNNTFFSVYVYKTNDEGNTWELISDDILYANNIENNDPDIHFLKFISSQKGYLGSSAGLFKTTDGGASWVLVTELNIFDFKSIADTEFVAASDDGILHTNDDFIHHENKVEMEFFSMAKPSNGMMYAVPVKTGSYKYSRNGTEWFNQPCPYIAKSYSANVFADALWVLGKGKAVKVDADNLPFIDTGVGIGKDEADDFYDAKESCLYYPNPSKSGLFKPTIEGIEAVCVYNALGTMVYKTGQCEVLNLSHLGEGIYFAISVYRGKKQTSKLIIG